MSQNQKEPRGLPHPSPHRVPSPTPALRHLAERALAASSALPDDGVHLSDLPASLASASPAILGSDRAGLPPIVAAGARRSRAEHLRRAGLLQVTRLRACLLPLLCTARSEGRVSDDEAYGLVLAVDDFLDRWTRTTDATMWEIVSEAGIRLDRSCAEWAPNNANDHANIYEEHA